MKQKIKFMAMMLMGILLGVTQVFAVEQTFFNETFGTPTGNTDVTSFEGWSETSVTYSGSAKVGVTTSNQCSMTGSSGSGYMYESSSTIKEFIVSGINTSGYSTVKLSINCKGGSSSAKFTISYSTDGSNFTNLVANQACTTGYKNYSPSANLPSATSLTIKITNTATSYALYFDDLKLTGTPAVQRTVSFNAGTHGTCSTSSLTEASAGAGVTLPSCTANTGYRFVGWSTSSEPTSANAGATGAKYTPRDNITLYAYYVPVYTATFLVGNSPFGAVNEYAVGEAIAFPNSKPEDINGKTFVGWTETPIDGTTDERPTLVGRANMGSGNKIYYAVFATKIGTGVTEYTKVTDLSVLEDGLNIVFVGSNNGTNYGMKMYVAEANNYKQAEITITDNVITTLGDAGEFTLGGATGAWTFYGGGNYIYAAGTKASGENYMKGKSESDDACLWTITLTDGTFSIKSVNNTKTPYMQYNYNQGNGMFSCYASENQSAVSLYYKGGASYEGYCTTVGTPHAITWIVNGEEYTVGDPTLEVIGDVKVTVLPTAPADNTLDCAEEFMGWSATPLGSRKGQSAPADLFETAEDSPVITEDVTFYAIFATVRK